MLASRTVWIILQGFTETVRTELMTTFGLGRSFEIIQTDWTGFLCTGKKIFSWVCK